MAMKFYNYRHKMKLLFNLIEQQAGRSGSVYVGPAPEEPVRSPCAAVEGDAQNAFGELSNAVRKIGRVHTLLLDHLSSLFQDLH